MDADFFLAGIAPDFAWIGDPLCSCFLNPGTHFILVLIEPISTKDLATCEWGWRRLLEPLPEREGVALTPVASGVGEE